MNKKQRIAAQQNEHSYKLLKIFPNMQYQLHPVEVYNKLRRIERKISRMNERECSEENFVYPEDFDAKQLQRIKKLLGESSATNHILLDGDPRGYALTIDDEYVKKHNLDINRDCFGYGILAPDFDGKY